MTHLLLVSLGPIQDFIASARRCQDLWFGSWLLSDLARAAAAALAQAADPEADSSALIFPAGLAEDKPGVANKLLLLVPGDQVREIAEKGRVAMQRRLDEIAAAAYERVPKPFFYRTSAEEQLKDLIEYIWVSVPLTDDNYASARDRAEALLAARKNTRPWRQVPWGAREVPKSSLDGQRESVLDEDLYDKQRSDRYRRKYFVKGKERLCGVGLLKRVGVEDDEQLRERLFGGQAPGFHSTSQVAAAPLLVRLATHHAQTDLDTYFDDLAQAGIPLERFRVRLRRSEPETIPLSDPLNPSRCVDVPRVFRDPRTTFGYDGSLLFSSRLLPILEEESDIEPSDLSKVDAHLRRSLQALLTGAMGMPRGREPTPYYAMLLGDGDRMGKAIDQLSKRKDGMAQHRKMSVALEEFTRRCREEVTKHGGSLIYAGGDDVLALLPLHTALQCATRLKDAFNKCVIDLPLGEERPTLSVGVAVCHHMEPMVEVRRIAHQAEKLAKVERDSLAIITKKRSGGALEIRAKWSEDLPARLWEWVRLFRDEALPDKAAFALEQAVLPLLDDKLFGASQQALQKVALSLAKRALLRRRSQRGEEDLSQKVRERLEMRLGQSEKDVRQEVLALSAELQTARLFLSAWQDAWGWEVEGGEE